MHNRTLDKCCVIITGSSGFIGSHASIILSNETTKALALRRDPLPGNSNLSGEPFLNVNDPEIGDQLKKLKPKAIVHCGGNASVPDSVKSPLMDFMANTAYTHRILELIRLYTPETHLIFTSSAAVYGSPKNLPISENSEIAPISPYGYHKWQAELACEYYSRIYGIPVTILRIFSAYGVGLRRQVLWDLSKKILNDKELVIHGTGEESRDFVDVRDVVRCINIISSVKRTGLEIYNLASGIECTIHSLAIKLMKAYRIELPIITTNAQQVGMPTKWRADISKIIDVCGNMEHEIDASITEYASWVEEQVRASKQ